MMQAGEEAGAETEAKQPVAQEDPPQNTGQDQRASGEGSKEHSAEKIEEKKEKKKAKTDSAAKLAFLEKKYKEVFAENNARKDEINKLVSLVQDFLKEIDVEVNRQDSYEIGDVSAYKTAYVDGWVRFRKKAEVDKRRAEEEAKNREKALQEELLKEKTEINIKKEQGIKEAKAASEKVIKNLEELNSKLQNDSNNLLNLLKTKDAEIAEVRKANLELSNKAADSLMDRFEKIEDKDLTSKLEQSSRVDEIIRLRNELDEAHEKIDNLEKQITLIQKRKQSNESSGTGDLGEPKIYTSMLRKGTDFAAQTDSDGNSSINPRKQGEIHHFLVSNNLSKYENLEDKLEKEALEKKHDEEELSKSYLKSLVVRYLIFEAKRNDSECNVLRRAILDCLKVSTEERATIDDAINNRGGLKDSVYFLRIFGGST